MANSSRLWVRELDTDYLLQFEKRGNVETTELNTWLLNDFIYNAHQTALKHGFWEDLSVSSITVLLSKLALIVSEVGEAVEAVRKGDNDNFVEELADICIRVFDVAGAIGADLQTVMVKKMKLNESRPHKHGKLA